MRQVAVALQNYEIVKQGYIEITVPTPLLGGKCWVLDRKGQFVLERGPGTLRTIACAGAGTGTLLMVDGLPDERGEIPNFAERDDPTWGWRQLFKANPVVMGSWMLDAGFNIGLTVRHYGGQISTPAIASIVWVPYKARK